MINLSTPDLVTLVRKVVTKVEGGHCAEAIAGAEEFREAGITAHMHVFKDKSKKVELTFRQTVEWYAGQLVAIVDDQSWFAMNSLINSLDKFTTDNTIGEPTSKE